MSQAASVKNAKGKRKRTRCCQSKAPLERSSQSPPAVAGAQEFAAHGAGVIHRRFETCTFHVVGGLSSPFSLFLPSLPIRRDALSEAASPQKPYFQGWGKIGLLVLEGGETCAEEREASW